MRMTITYRCLLGFDRMDVGLFLNHSDQPNVNIRSIRFIAQTDIIKGDEITINYHDIEGENPTVLTDELI